MVEVEYLWRVISAAHGVACEFVEYPMLRRVEYGVRQRTFARHSTASVLSVSEVACTKCQKASARLLVLSSAWDLVSSRKITSSCRRRGPATANTAVHRL